MYIDCTHASLLSNFNFVMVPFDINFTLQVNKRLIRRNQSINAMDTYARTHMACQYQTLMS